MKGDLRCVQGRLMRHDPQPDDPNLETDRGVCPDCEGRGCEVPEVAAVHTTAMNAIEVRFTMNLSVAEVRDFDAYVREWDARNA